MKSESELQVRRIEHMRMDMHKSGIIQNENKKLTDTILEKS